MKLGHHLVDVGRKSKAPVDVVLVSVETAFFPNLSELPGKVVVVVGDAESDAQIAFVADLVALVGDPDLEVAKVLVLVRLERWFTEDFTQDLPGDLVAFTWLRVQVGLAFGVPILLLGCLEFPAFVGVANELSGVELFDRRLHLGDRCGFANFVDQECGEVGLGARKITHELQQANHLGNPRGPALILGIVLESLADVMNVGAFLGR